MTCKVCESSLGFLGAGALPVRSRSGRKAEVCSRDCRDVWHRVIEIAQLFNDQLRNCPSCAKAETMEPYFQGKITAGIRCEQCETVFRDWEVRKLLANPITLDPEKLELNQEQPLITRKADKPLTVVEAAKLGQATANSIDLSDLLSVLPLLSTASERITALREINDQHEEQYRLAVISTLKAKNPDSVLPDNFVSKEVLRAKEFGLKVLNETPELQENESSVAQVTIGGTQIKKSAKWSDLKKNL